MNKQEYIDKVAEIMEIAANKIPYGNIGSNFYYERIILALYDAGLRFPPKLEVISDEEIKNERLTFPYTNEPQVIDEAVLHNADVHLEQLNDECYMLIIKNPRHYWHLNIYSKNKRSKVIATLYEDNSPARNSQEN